MTACASFDLVYNANFEMEHTGKNPADNHLEFTFCIFTNFDTSRLCQLLFSYTHPLWLNSQLLCPWVLTTIHCVEKPTNWHQVLYRKHKASRLMTPKVCIWLIIWSVCHYPNTTEWNKVNTHFQHVTNYSPAWVAETVKRAPASTTVSREEFPISVKQKQNNIK